MDQISNNAFEPWMLTAYVLNDLDEEKRCVVDEHLKRHPELVSEVESIRSMVGRVEVELARLQDAIPIRTGDIRASDPLSGALVSKSEILHEAKTMEGYSSRRRGRFAAFLLTGLAASVAAGTLWMVRPVKQELSEFASSSSTEDRFGSLQAESKDTAGKVVSDAFGSKSAIEELRENVSDGEGMDQGLPEAGKSLSQAELGLPPGPASRDLSSASSVPGAASGALGLGLGRGLGESSGSVPRRSSSSMLGAGGGAGLADITENGPAIAGGMPSSERMRSVESKRFGRFAQEPQGQADSLPRLKLRDKEAEVAGGSGRYFSDEKALWDGLKNPAEGAREFDVPDELRANVPSFEYRRPYVKEGGDRFDRVVENGFLETRSEPLSTFSIDVDTASYTKLRQNVLEQNVVPRSESIRIEEWLNYFDYQYAGPKGDEPFAAHLRMAQCPWNARHKLVRVAIQAKRVEAQQRPASNLVFLIDVSGSMADANKLPLVKRTLTLLANQLREEDRVAIVVYAGAAGCVLPSTTGDQRERILASINELQSGGSTNGGQGIELAYRLAKENYIEGGVNRVILCTDGDFNVGVTSNDALVALVREQAKGNVFMTCLGYGSGNYNDSMMERITNEGNGIYGMVDSELEARRVMGKQLNGNLMTVAKDVKIQVEFNPRKVQSYRLLGYENRRLAAADFNNDKKDAGEIGAGHCVTALYEVVPVGQEGSVPGSIDGLRYAGGSEGNGGLKSDEVQVAESLARKELAEVSSAISKEWLLLKVRSKTPEGSVSTKQEFVLEDPTEGEVVQGEQEVRDMQWALSVAEFGLLMRRSAMAPEMDWDRMLTRAYESSGEDPLRRECVIIMQRAKSLVGR